MIKLILALFLFTGCGITETLMTKKDVKTARRVVDAVSGCYTESVKSCKVVHVTKKRFLLGDKRVPVSKCTNIQVRRCPGEKGYKK